MSIIKNLGPISLLLCLRKIFEKCLTSRVAEAARATGTIAEYHNGSKAYRSAIDSLMLTLSPTNEWMQGKNYVKKGKVLRPRYSQLTSQVPSTVSIKTGYARCSPTSACRPG